MNAKQEEVLKTITELLGEHFDGYVLSVESGRDEVDSQTYTYWGGGFNSAFGMAHRQVERMRVTSETADDDSHPGDDEWKEKV